MRSVSLQTKSGKFQLIYSGNRTTKLAPIGVSFSFLAINGFPEPVWRGSGLTYAFFLSANYQGMDDELLVLRLTELRAQLADIQRRVDELDNLLDGEVTDEAVKQYAAELLKIVEDREPILREARSLLMLVNDATPGGGAVN